MYVHVTRRSLVINVTAIIVMITVFIQGGLTEPFIRWLKISMNVKMADYIRGLNVDEHKDATDFEKKYIYPWVLRKKPSSLRISLPDYRPTDLVIGSPTSSGGGTLYDGNHAREMNQQKISPTIDDNEDPYRGMSTSAKRSVRATTPNRRISNPTNIVWSLESSPQMSIGDASILATAAASGSFSGLYFDDHILSDENERLKTQASDYMSRSSNSLHLNNKSCDDINDFSSFDIPPLSIKPSFAQIHEECNFIEADIESLIESMHHGDKSV